jgi:hypothetical protein
VKAPLSVFNLKSIYNFKNAFLRKNRSFGGKLFVKAPSLVINAESDHDLKTGIQRSDFPLLFERYMATEI